MDVKESILKTIRKSVGLSATTTDFDDDLIIHINGAIGRLNQNGIGKFLIVVDEEQTWENLQDPVQTDGNMFFQMVPLYIALSTKLLFDPPPPSNVQYHSDNAKELLWRLKVAYEQYETTETVTGGE